MPWTPKSARRHTKKAKSSKQQRQWSHVANAQLKRGLSEGAAIASANAAVKKSRGKGAHVARKRRGKRGRGKRHGKK